MPKILVVAMTESVHTARWINELIDLGWDIHLFPSLDLIIHPSICDVTVHGFYVKPEKNKKTSFFPGAFPCPNQQISYYANIGLQKLQERYLEYHHKNIDSIKVKQLVQVIKKIKPDIIHTLEMQHAGYITQKAKEMIGVSFPTWIYTPWGNDIYFFGRLPNHIEKIKAVLTSCNYYAPKSDRDIRLANEYGFKGEFLSLLPGNGGFDTGKMRSLWQKGKSSERKKIIVKGYQGIMGRSLVALYAIELCSECLKDFTIDVFSANNEVKIKAQIISHDTGLKMNILPPCSHEEMLKYYGQSRFSVGLSLSDGISNSLLESMAMGTFPIESNTSCADEWVTNGKNGFIVPPEDPVYVAERIRAAATNDDLIDNAAAVNFEIIRNRMDNSVIKPKILDLYSYVLKKSNQSKDK